MVNSKKLEITIMVLLKEYVKYFERNYKAYNIRLSEEYFCSRPHNNSLSVKLAYNIQAR
jgi:predicted transcriptional regulator